MDKRQAVEFQWAYIERFIGSDGYLEQSAEASGALVRRRGVRTASALLKLAMLYAFCGFSLRQTATMAAENGIADVSDVALLNRFRRAAPWFGELLGQMLRRNAAAALPSRGLRLRLVDATAVTAVGSRHTDWRVHLGFDLRAMRINDIELTSAAGAETLDRFDWRPGDLVVADRGYSHRKAFARVAQMGAYFLVRANWNNTPVETGDGARFDVLAALRGMPDGTPAEFNVYYKAHGKSWPARLIAVRKSEPAAALSRKKVLLHRSQKSRGLDPAALESAGYIYVLTNVPPDQLSPTEALELYRFRWQIELCFKRLKGLINLDNLPAKDPALAQMYLTTKLLGALVIDALTDRYVSFSPWGYNISGPVDFVLARAEDLS